MLSKLSAFTNLPMPLRVVLLVASGAGLMALIRFLPPSIYWMVFIGIAVLSLLLLLYWCLVKRLKKRRAAPMERGLIDNSAASVQGVSDPARIARIDELRKRFEEGIEKYKTAGKDVYNLPWYMVVGEPGSGKTEAIRHCNIGFPAGLQDKLQGAGGTLDMNWWFTDHAVILDTAGRLMFDEGASSEWKEFLSLLKQYRKNCPINGMFLFVPTDSLIKDSADEIERKASRIAQQFDLIQRELDVRFPVFVIISKSDKLNGFREFFDNLEDPNLQHQIMGWSNPAEIDEPFSPTFIDQHLETMQSCLQRRRFGLLLQQITTDDPEIQETRKIENLYAFPQSLTKITIRMRRYLELIFSVGSQWSCKPLFFRGIYFTSAMQEGSALDEDLAESLGVPVDSLPGGQVWKEDRAYFLRDLFIKKVFKEKGLVTRATSAKKQHARRKAVVLVSGIVALMLLLFFTVYASIGFNKSIGEMKAYFAVIADEMSDSGSHAFELIKDDGGGVYRYVGGSEIEINKSKVLRYELYSKLFSVIEKWLESGVPWVFAPAAGFADEIEGKSLYKTQAVLYENGVLHPYLDAARNTMTSQKSGSWTRDDSNTKVLYQLIAVQTNKPFNNEDKSIYTAATFLDPLFRYVSIEGDDDYKQVLSQSLDRIYKGGTYENEYEVTWPPESIRKKYTISQAPGTVPSSPVFPAIEHGVEDFINFWADPNSGGDVDSASYTVATISELTKAFDLFADAEMSISLIDSEGNDYVASWTKSLRRLNDIGGMIAKYDEVLGRPGTDDLVKLGTEGRIKAVDEITENYQFLLEAMSDGTEEKNGMLGALKETVADQVNVQKISKTDDPFADIRTDLKRSRDKKISQLEGDEFEEKLKQLSRLYWTKHQNGDRLYELRLNMYRQAGKQLDLPNDVSAIRSVPANISAVDDFYNKSISLYKKDSEIFKDARRASIHAILKGVLTVVEEPEDEYDVEIASEVIAGWKSIGDAINNAEYDIRDINLKKHHERMDLSFRNYQERYINYWLNEYPRKQTKQMVVFAKDWTQQHNQFRDIDKRKIIRKLIEIGEKMDNALREIKRFTDENEKQKKKIRNFMNNRENLEKRWVRQEFEDILNDWEQLDGDGFKAREKFLEIKTGQSVKNYFPYNNEKDLAFYELYWHELTYQALNVLAGEIDKNSKDALKELSGEYGKKFPLAWTGNSDLTKNQANKAHRLLRKVRPSTGKSEKDAEKLLKDFLDDSAADDIDKLSGVSLEKSETFKSVENVLRVIPNGDEPYYCKIYVLNYEKQQDFDEEVRLFDYLRYIKIIQGDKKSKRLKAERGDIEIGVFEYPGKPIVMEFFEHIGDESEPPDAKQEFDGPWAAFKILRHGYVKDKGVVRIKVKHENKDLMLYLKLEFYEDRQADKEIIFPDSLWKMISAK